MSRRSRQRNAFARLALLAALLLATVPTLGRLLAPEAAASTAHVAHAMHAMAGMQHAMSHDVAHLPAIPPPHQHDVDCPYCPLLGTVLATPLRALALAAPIPPAFDTPRFTDPHEPVRHHGSLGSRGPPSAA